MLKNRIYDPSVVDRVSEAAFTRDSAGSEWECHNRMDVIVYQFSGRDVLCVHLPFVTEGHLSQLKAGQRKNRVLGEEIRKGDLLQMVRIYRISVHFHRLCDPDLVPILLNRPCRKEIGDRGDNAAVITVIVADLNRTVVCPVLIRKIIDDCYVLRECIMLLAFLVFGKYHETGGDNVGDI